MFLISRTNYEIEGHVVLLTKDRRSATFLFVSFQSIEENDLKSETGRKYDKMVQVQIDVKIIYDEISACSDVWGIVEDWKSAMRWKWARTAYT